MALIDPTKSEYLAVVDGWSSYGAGGVPLGHAFPIFCLTRNEPVIDVMEEFPDTGYIFLLNRGALNTWDFIRLRPEKNRQHTDGKARYVVGPTPAALDEPIPNCLCATLLDVADFDPTTAMGVIRNPSQNVSPVFFIQSDRGKIFGPLRRVQVSRSGYERIDAIQWVPFDADNLVYECTLEDLGKAGIRVAKFSHPDGDRNEVTTHPIRMLVGPVLSVTTLKAHDRLPDAQLVEWYLRWRNLPAIPEAQLRAFQTAADHLAETTPDAIRRRCQRVGRLFSTIDVLQAERAAVARRYLESEEGQKTLRQQLDKEVERRVPELEREVAKRRTELASEKQKLSEQLQNLDDERRRHEDSLQNQLADLHRQRADLEKAVASLQTHLQADAAKLATRLERHVPLLAALGGGIRTATVTPEANGRLLAEAPVWGKVEVPRPSKELEDLKDEAALLNCLEEELGGDPLGFHRDFLANLWITLKSSALNLIMGPPGYGKSSVVAALAKALGHGNALLEIAVRRSWSDDRYLLGFYDTFHGRYDPGPTGLATRLLQAQQDWDSIRHGLYFILLDEFNLAAPEYYFSELLQIATRPPELEHRLRLFDPAGMPPTAAAQPHQVKLNPNVSFWGTINYDETTERLSPRLLDRTGMIFLTARDVLPAATPTARPLVTKGVKAGQVFQQFVRRPNECPAEHWELLVPLLDFLKQPSDEYGPGIDLSPRVREAVKRYLANAGQLLTPARAVDFVFQQRVLPVLRGRGIAFAARVKALVEKLTAGGFERSARHVREALALAELNFGDIDFLAYL